MRTLKKLTFLTLALLISSLVFGQPEKGKKPNKEKIKAMKVGYITEKLDLTSDEAQQFWPIYNEFDAKMDGIHKSIRKTRKPSKSLDEMTDGEVEKMINAHDDLRQKELDTHKEYHLKFKAVLPIKKVAKLYKADQGFKRDLLKKIKNHRREVDEEGNFKKGHPPHGPRN